MSNFVHVGFVRFSFHFAFVLPVAVVQCVDRSLAVFVLADLFQCFSDNPQIPFKLADDIRDLQLSVKNVDRLSVGIVTDTERPLDAACKVAARKTVIRMLVFN